MIILINSSIELWLLSDNVFFSLSRQQKAGGDIKKVGQHDPYVYVPLNMAQLNKRYVVELNKRRVSGVVVSTSA